MNFDACVYVVGDEDEVQGPVVQSSIKLIFG